MSPMAPRRECAYPSCHVLIPGGVDRYRCKRHDTDRQRGSSAARGYGAAWRKLRMEILRARPICEATGCGRAAAHVDHIVARARGGSDDVSNLQAMCAPCHGRKGVAHDGALRAEKR